MAEPARWPAGSTVTVVSAALCGPPRPALSSSHRRKLYRPGPGAASCAAAPRASTLMGARQVVWQSCAIAPVIGAGGSAGSRHDNVTMFEPGAPAVALSACGGGGPSLSTTAVGDVTIWLLPAASVTMSVSACGPSRTRVVSILSTAEGCWRQGGAAVKSQRLRRRDQRLTGVRANRHLANPADVARGECHGHGATDEPSAPGAASDVRDDRRQALGHGDAGRV